MDEETTARLIAACEANQAAWNEAVAIAGGGSRWADGALRWSWQAHDRQLMLNFPAHIDAVALSRGIDAAARSGAAIVGAWLNPRVDPEPLERAGFERGWEPWWMAAPIEAVAPPADPRAALDPLTPEYDADGQALLTLARGPAPRAWHAAARVDGRFAGRAWGFLPAASTHAGVYDMEVWPRFARRGLGRALLREVCAAVRAAGAAEVVLNATPDGERLYSTEGFVRIGEGITYWLHRGGG